jgi:arginine N-succinyltransferase
MYILRPIQKNDLTAFEGFANQSSLGVINLPKNREILKEKIYASEYAFQTPIEKPHHENYVFVLEDLQTGELGGTSAICSRMGITSSNYYFRLETSLNAYTKKEMQILTPVCYPVGPTEILALYLKPEFRKEGLGKLLSLARFLFMASHRQRFENYVVAEMRGYIREDNTVPFWDSFCRKFLDITYAEFCLNELKNRDIISNLIPKWPVYVSLLPQEVQDYLGKTHDKTLPALRMLNREGFVFTQEIDPFDGGPRLGCRTDEIETLKNSQTAILDSIETPYEQKEPAMLISNTRLDFRACFGNLTILEPGLAALPAEIAQALQVSLGDEIRFVNKTSSKEKI